MRPRGKRESGRPWYALIHQLPPEPLYLRAKIRQRLERIGAVALKNAVYILPRREDCLEDFQWIAQEAAAGGGEAHICEAEFVEAGLDKTLIAQFRSARNADYEAVAEALRSTAADPDAALRLARARKRFEEITKIDFFDAPARRQIEKLLKEMESRPRRRTTPPKLKGKTWVTRRGVHIDRIASAWLIRRFLDPKARFRFVDPKERRRSGEVSFDMPGGDFSHEGDRCTFETLLARTGLTDRGLGQIGEIVHDIDLKDEKFRRPEAPGVERLVTGLVLSNPEDKARLERGFVLFDQLYESFRKHPKEASK